MAKRQTGWTENKIAKYYKEGRGSGELSNYKPWLTVQDVPSRGRTHRPKGWKTNRIHQLLSDLEYNYFCLLDWIDEVIDIREQFPLNREATLKIADSKEIKHPVDPNTQTPIVMTTDFLLTIRRNNEIVNLARTIKSSGDLESETVRDKFEIERAYWEEQGVNWGIVTDNELKSEAVENIKWLHKAYFDDFSNQVIIEQLLYFLANKQQQIIKTLTDFDENYNLEKGTRV